MDTKAGFEATGFALRPLLPAAAAAAASDDEGEICEPLPAFVAMFFLISLVMDDCPFH